MVFSILYNLITKSFLVLLVAMLSVNWLPDKLFHDFPFEPVSLDSIDYDSVIPQWNTKLTDNKPEYIQLNNIVGPESLAIHPSNPNLLYTGLADGRLVELDSSKQYKMRQVLRFKQSPRCLDNMINRATECGRFLQVKFANQTLYASEANSGLYKIDIKTGTKTFVGPSPALNKVNLFNSFAFDPKEPNIVYISISSTRWPLGSIIWSLLELESTGKIIAIDINTGKQVIVVENLMFSNGLDVDAKRDELVFAETTRSRVSSICLRDVRAAFKKAKTGESIGNIKRTALIPITPGNPDNIVIVDDIAYIALPFVRPNGKQFVDHLSTMKSLRKSYGRFIYGVGLALQYICENLYHHPLLEVAYEELKSGHFNYRVINTDSSAIIEYNLASKTSRFLGSGNFSYLSEATPDNKGNLLLGSFRSPFIVKVKV